MTGVRRASGAAAIVLALVLSGCAPTSPASTTAPAPSTPSPPASTPAQSPAPTPTPTDAPSDPYAGWQQIATPNGTATFRIPPGWIAEIEGEEVDYDGETHWVNEIVLRDAAGELTLSYGDGPYDDVGAAADFGVVRSTPVATLDDAELEAAPVEGYNRLFLDHRATAWWVSSDGVTFRAHAGLAIPPGDSQPLPRVTDGHRSVTFGTSAEFGSEAEAVAWLEGDDVTAVLEIVATLDLTGIPAPALP